MKAAGVLLSAVMVLAAGYAVGGPAGLFVIAGAAALGALLHGPAADPGPVPPGGQVRPRPVRQRGVSPLPAH